MQQITYMAEKRKKLSIFSKEITIFEFFMPTIRVLVVSQTAFHRKQMYRWFSLNFSQFQRFSGLINLYQLRRVCRSLARSFVIQKYATKYSLPSDVWKHFRTLEATLKCRPTVKNLCTPLHCPCRLKLRSFG